ncbi:hypothetical protein AM587_10001959 [Phytophthora nicotianae]|uniref:Core-binding (CB) domain-containing protein n=1 Tax=Phytophthora nicotianae TaxID=4792 RepID=A0A0W8DZV7_PHYNI|nr:hypothetical protein AM587_10001959 [Phytophthora nicotianae]
MAIADVEAIRDACVTKETRGKYKSSLNGIAKWIRKELAKVDHNTDRFFDSSGELNLMEFTPPYFEQFLVYKSRGVKAGTLSGYRSAIKDLYRVRRLALPPEYGDGMKQLFSGMKRMEADSDQISNPKTSGKQPLTYSLYQKLCKETLELGDGGFSHLFLSSQWNLMCRSISVQTVQTQHFVAKDDGIGVIFVKTKTNQEGTGPRDPRHVYANPLSPSTCWVTALAIYLACHPRLQQGPLFPGSNQKLRFSKALGSLLKLDGSAKTYGTHSVRKGVATFACGGSTGGPSIVSVCLRCGWSLGGVQDRYFRYEAAGDQFLGRVVAGLPINDSKLPPHFMATGDSTTTSVLRTVFPSLADEPNLNGILQLCLASLVFHREYLQQNMPTNHPLLSTIVFTSVSVFHSLQEQLQLGDSSWMHPTGIPPYIELYKKLDKQQQSIDLLPDKLEQRMEAILEKKGVAAGNITRDLLHEEIRALLEEVGLQKEKPAALSTLSTAQTRYYHTWGGKFHVLPKDFAFPSIDPLGAWILWWFGNPELNYPPYKGIPSDDLDTPQKKVTLSEWSVMMRHIINGIEKDLRKPMPAIRDEVHAIELFKIGYNTLELKPSKRKRRNAQIKLTTVLRLIREAGQEQRSPDDICGRPLRRRKWRTRHSNSTCATGNSSVRDKE